VTLCDLGVADLAAVQHAACDLGLATGGAMDSAIDPTTAEQRGVGGVDDGIDRQFGDIAGMDSDSQSIAHLTS